MDQSHGGAPGSTEEGTTLDEIIHVTQLPEGGIIRYHEPPAVI